MPEKLAKETEATEAALNSTLYLEGCEVPFLKINIRSVVHFLAPDRDFPSPILHLVMGLKGLPLVSSALFISLTCGVPK